MEVQNQIYRSIKGDYIGFTFGGIHSSELGLLRVSDGSRYNTDLLPPLQDKTVQVSGRDGAVYFNSTYNTKPIKVPVAFDNMNEESFQKLKRLLADKKPKYLWFDETPYKQWLVKSATAQSFKWVCFDETNIDGEKRRYKGEGTLEFNCFTPYAESRVQFLDDPVDYVWVWNRDKSPKRLIKKNERYTGDFQMLRKKITKTDSSNIQTEIMTQYDSSKNSGWLIFHGGWIYNSRTDEWSINYYIRFPKPINGTYEFGLGNRIFYIDSDEEKNEFLQFLNSKPNDDSYELKYLDTVHKNETVKELSFTTFSPAIISWTVFQNGIETQKTEQVQGAFTIESESEKQYLSILYKKSDDDYCFLDYDSSKQEGEKYFFNDGKSIYCFSYLINETEPVTLIDNYNFKEWEKASSLRGKISLMDEKTKIVYNAGDVPTYPQIIFKKWDFKEKIEIEEESKKISKIVFSLYKQKTGEADENIGELRLKPLREKISSRDDGIIIDSKLKMIKGIDSTDSTVKLTGSVYNKYHTDGDFFNIPVQESDENYYITVRYIFLNEDNQEIEDNPEYLTDYDVKYTHYYI